MNGKFFSSALALLAVLLTACPSPEADSKSKTALSTDRTYFIYGPISAVQGETTTVNFANGGGPDAAGGGDFTFQFMNTGGSFRATSNTDGITIDNKTGAITIAKTVGVQEPTKYQVMVIAAGGNSKWTGSRLITVSIAVTNTEGTEADLGTANPSPISYNLITATIGTEEKQAVTNAANGLFRYTFKTTGGAMSPPAGITVNPSTGEITVAATTPVQTQTPYMVTVTADSTNTQWKGSRDIMVSITVIKAELRTATSSQIFYRKSNSNNITYATNTVYATAGSQTKQSVTNNAGGGGTFAYVPVNNSSVISVNPTTGEITVAAGASTSNAGNYVVTVTAQNNTRWTGSKDITVYIAVRADLRTATTNQISYSAITATAGTETKQPVINNAGGGAFTYGIANENVPITDGTKTSPPVITVNPTTGEITVTAGASSNNNGSYLVTVKAAANNTKWVSQKNVSVTITIN